MGVIKCTTDNFVDEILKADALRDWTRLRELIWEAEDMQFSADQSKKLGPRLLNIALLHRDDMCSHCRSIILSAIRTGGSMLRPCDAHLLLPLLESGHPISTSLEAVKMVGRIFEAQPPTDVDQYMELTFDICYIVELLLDRYVIENSQSAAMALLAIYVLAAMASSKVLDIIGIVRGLGVSWFAKQVRHDLCSLQIFWNKQYVPVESGPYKLLDRAIRELSND